MDEKQRVPPLRPPVERPNVSPHVREEDVRARMRAEDDTTRTMREMVISTVSTAVVAYFGRNLPGVWQVLIGAGVWVVVWTAVHQLGRRSRQKDTTIAMLRERITNINVVIANLSTGGSDKAIELFDRMVRELSERNETLKEELAHATKSDADNKAWLRRYQIALEDTQKLAGEAADAFTDAARLAEVYRDAIDHATKVLGPEVSDFFGALVARPAEERITRARDVLRAGRSGEALHLAIAVAIANGAKPGDFGLKRLGDATPPALDSGGDPNA